MCRWVKLRALIFSSLSERAYAVVERQGCHCNCNVFSKRVGAVTVESRFTVSINSLGRAVPVVLAMAFLTFADQ